MMWDVYISGPIFSDQDRAFVLQVEEALKPLTCFVPFRDAGDWTEVGREHCFNHDISGIFNSVVMVAILEGADVDSGTAGEMGFAYGNLKPIFGISTDRLRRQKHINAFILGLLNNQHQVCKTIDELVDEVKNAVKIRKKA